MSIHSFDYLIGSMSVPEEAPDKWETNGLDEFYKDPNNEAWNGKLSRILYHESIHFWQFFSSGYLANLLTEDWTRFSTFNDTGMLAAASGNAEKHVKANNYPFSAAELIECWARYWDVHTRSPVQILKEDKVLANDPEVIEILHSSDSSNSQGYTNIFFDAFMFKGKDSKNYARPYRWMNEQADGASRLVNTVFPALVHGAFGNPDPIKIFCEAFSFLQNSKELKEEIMAHSTNNIHFNWFNSWKTVSGIINDIIENSNKISYTSGVQVIAVGPLKAHPIYKKYIQRVELLFKRLKLLLLEAQAPGKYSNLEETYTAYVNYFERTIYNRDPFIALGLPGQPNYRSFLGHYVAPPCVHFTNITVYSYKTPYLYKKENKETEEDQQEFINTIKELNEKVIKYRNVIKADQLGLPLNTFG